MKGYFISYAVNCMNVKFKRLKRQISEHTIGQNSRRQMTEYVNNDL